MISENGSAVAIVADCSAASPPVRRSAPPIRPCSAHQKTRWRLLVSVAPPAASVSTTSEPESDEVTKNTATSRTATDDVSAGNGRYWKNWKSATDRSLATAADKAPLATVVSMYSAV